jgi:hypothetical protein
MNFPEDDEIRKKIPDKYICNSGIVQLIVRVLGPVVWYMVNYEYRYYIQGVSRMVRQIS